jgi:hypothetical protein
VDYARLNYLVFKPKSIMGKQFSEISVTSQEFIKNQQIFFVATATHDSRVNLSPKGMDSFRVIDKNRIIWLNVTGSGNETAAHLLENNRMTVMFCAFEGKPMILRLYGTAKAIHERDPKWKELITKFPETSGKRQIFDMNVDLVQTSCGMSVPFFEYQEERSDLSNWAEKKGKEGIQEYWEKNNQTSLDGKPTNIFSD